MRLTTVRNVYDAVPVEHELIISVGVNTFKTKGVGTRVFHKSPIEF